MHSAPHSARRPPRSARANARPTAPPATKTPPLAARWPSAARSSSGASYPLPLPSSLFPSPPPPATRHLRLFYMPVPAARPRAEKYPIPATPRPRPLLRPTPTARAPRAARACVEQFPPRVCIAARCSRPPPARCSPPTAHRPCTCSARWKRTHHAARCSCPPHASPRLLPTAHFPPSSARCPSPLGARRLWVPPPPPAARRPPPASATRRPRTRPAIAASARNAQDPQFAVRHSPPARAGIVLPATHACRLNDARTFCPPHAAHVAKERHAALSPGTLHAPPASRPDSPRLRRPSPRPAVRHTLGAARARVMQVPRPAIRRTPPVPATHAAPHSPAVRACVPPPAAFSCPLKEKFARGPTRTPRPYHTPRNSLPGDEDVPPTPRCKRTHRARPLAATRAPVQDPRALTMTDYRHSRLAAVCLCPAPTYIFGSEFDRQLQIVRDEGQAAASVGWDKESDCATGSIRDSYYRCFRLLTEAEPG
ncbi:hypothetical protein GGX14DRAFT_395532 [Mycena pura]|uniref:Uncharacterized protein n=1 Tax=Mycena pura TaxID=153505 RepID=A0AAD6VEE1_9AGAR|nr:hypothetical protein GGX14DRAFT_395532 [Mycena pura]